LSIYLIFSVVIVTDVFEDSMSEAKRRLLVEAKAKAMAVLRPKARPCLMRPR